MTENQFPKTLRPFLSTDDTRSISSPILATDGWEATDNHRLAWVKCAHTTPLEQAIFTHGPKAMLPATGLESLRHSLLHHYVLSFTVDVNQFANWVGVWPRALGLNLYPRRGEGARAELVRHLNPKNKKTKCLELVTADATTSLQRLGCTWFDSPEYFTDQNGINARYLDEAMRFAGGYVYTRKDCDEPAPWIVTPLKNELGTPVDGEELLAQPCGCVIMPVRP